MAHQNGYIDPTLFLIATSVLALTIIVLGGINSPIGAVFGAIVLVGLPELLRITPDVRILGYGLLLLVIIRFRPQGLFTRSEAARGRRGGQTDDGSTPSGPPGGGSTGADDPVLVRDRARHLEGATA